MNIHLVVVGNPAAHHGCALDHCPFRGNAVAHGKQVIDRCGMRPTASFARDLRPDDQTCMRAATGLWGDQFAQCDVCVFDIRGRGPSCCSGQLVGAGFVCGFVEVSPADEPLARSATHGQGIPTLPQFDEDCAVAGRADGLLVQPEPTRRV